MPHTLVELTSAPMQGEQEGATPLKHPIFTDFDCQNCKEKMDMTIRVLIVEDQRIVREGLRAVLEDEDEIVIVGEAANGQEAIDLFTKLKPDVVLMDLQMPVMDGPESTRRIRELSPEAHILVLTTYVTDEFIFKALRAGAQGYLLKDASADELVGVSTGGPESLTPRELEVLTLMGQGRSNSEIAASLSIAPPTAIVHVQT